MKLISFDGRIGSGAEVKSTRGGKPYVKFSVANNSFVGGQDKTEWFDVTSYDPYVIENRVKYLTKGTYVIISGNINTEVNVDRNNRVWVNQYVTANTIDTPSFKKKEDETVSVTSEPSISTYSSPSPQPQAEPQAITSAPSPSPQPQVVPQPAVQAVAVAQSTVPAYAAQSDDDDLPF